MNDYVREVGTVTDTYGREVPVVADHDAVRIGDHIFSFEALADLLVFMDEAVDVAGQYASLMGDASGDAEAGQ